MQEWEITREELLRRLWKEGIYGVVVIIFCINLYLLNKELKVIEFANAFQLLLYKEYTPIKFFFGALILVAIGTYLMVKNISELFYTEKIFWEDMLIDAAKSILLFILIVTIIILINNPILRAILATI